MFAQVSAFLAPHPVARKVVSADVAAKMEQYDELAGKVGINVPNYKRARIFEQYLREKDWPIYSLPAVTKYLNKMAKAQGARHGWGWHPLRSKDRIEATFGTGRETTPRFDWYHHSHFGVYQRRVPYHALERVHAIETECNPLLLDKGCQAVAFFVSEYTVERPDPFLLAVLPQPNDYDPPRYVIDFWDEPGFGIEQMVK